MIGHGAGVAFGIGDWLGIVGLIIVAVSVIGVLILVGWIADRRAPASDATAEWDDPDLHLALVKRFAPRRYQPV